MDKVLLGLPGQWAHNWMESSANFTSKVGGLPDWPLPNELIRPDLLHCAVCGSKLCLIAQVYAPISESKQIEERLLFVLGCVLPDCGSKPESWRVLRIQKSRDGEKSCIAPKDVASLSTTFVVHNTRQRDDTDEDSEDDMDLEDLGWALFDAGSLASNSKKAQTRSHPETSVTSTSLSPTTRVIDSDIPVLPCFYTYTQEASSTNDLDSISSNYSSLSIINKREGSGSEDSSQEETWDEEKYEHDKSLGADRTYLKFKKRLDANPDQCYRYSYGGKPLLATNDEVNPSPCKLCGESRQFEMQFMPPLLYFLREAVNGDHKEALENWIWLTLIVFTCSKSCARTNEDRSNSMGWVVAEEAVLLQCEEDLPGFKELGF